MLHTSEAGMEKASITDGGVKDQEPAHEARSQRSTSSSTSKVSSASTAATKARAKVEAARARASFVQREAELKIKEAHLAADLKVKEARIAAELSALEHEREIAVALAEAEVLEAAAEIKGTQGSRSLHDSVQAAMQRTLEYVEHHSQLRLSDEKPPVLEPYTPSLLPLIKPDVQSDRKERFPGPSSASHF